MTKIWNCIKFTSLVLVLLIAVLIEKTVALFMGVIGFCKIFTGCKFQQGEPVNFRNHHNIAENQATMLQSEQGSILFCHGKNDGSLVKSVEELSTMVPPGVYWLVSCYNGCRNNFEINERIFLRPEVTQYNSPSFHIYIGWGVIVVGALPLPWFNKLMDMNQGLLQKADRLHEEI